jgi:hypothetical protein
MLIKGGHVIDPAAGIDAPMDVLLRDLTPAGSLSRPDSLIFTSISASRDRRTKKPSPPEPQLRRREDLRPFAACPTRSP